MTDPSDFEGSIRRKIVLEIAGASPKVLPAAHRAAGPPTDCTAAGT